MDKILLQLTVQKERRRLEDWLSGSYDLVLTDPADLEQDFDLAILDGSSLRKLKPTILARRKREEPVVLPFLLVTIRRYGNLPSRHLGRLVDDVILRPLSRKELIARVANLLRMRRWSLDLKKEHDRAMKLAVTDDVSGFNNTRYLHRYLDRAIDENGKSSGLCLVFFDVDNFKALVDTHGHLLGSKALKEVAQTVNRVLDEQDRIVRYGGDEFIVMLPRQTPEEAAVKVARMREAIFSARFLQKEGIGASLTASFGMACYPQDAKDKHQLLAQADRCLFQSKSRGKNRVTIFENLPGDTEVQSRET